MKVLGLDEAGRGPVIGPMVIAGVLISQENITYLSSLGVRDSKLLSPNMREKLVDKIRQIADEIKIVEISPKEIDERFSLRKTLNVLEAENMAKIIACLKPNIVYVDAADIKANRFTRTIKSFLPHSMKKITIISEHKADRAYPVVSAASIIAKVRRDELISRLKEIYGDFGSGYPSDKKTIKFLENYVKRYHKLPDCVRETWLTARKIYEKYVLQKKLL